MVGRGELTDTAWAQIAPLLPSSGRGGQWRDHRQVINAILFTLRTGAPWRDLPDRYGPWKMAHERLRRWTADGTWESILDQAVVKDDRVGDLEWVVSVDSTVVRAHQHAAGARKKGAVPPPGGAYRPRRRGPGPVEGRTEQHNPPGRRRPGAPMRVILTPGQDGDNLQLAPLLAGLRVPRVGPGRPRCRPAAVIADKAYSHPSTRRMLRRRRIRFTSPERADQKARRAALGRRGGRPPGFDAVEYKRRNVVERRFNRLKQFRDLATRYAKRAAYYRAELLLAATILRLR